MLITPNLSNLQRILHILAATQEVPQHNRLLSRGSMRVPPTSRGAPFPPHSSRGGILSLRGWERIPSVPVAPQEDALSKERREELQGRATIRRDPQISQSIPGKPVFPSLPRLSSRGSTHTTVARGTALWESLVGKPRGKTRGKATDPLIHVKGSVTLLEQLGRKAHVHAPTKDEDCLPWGDSRITPRSMSAMVRNPQVPAPTPNKILGPGIDGRGNPRGPRATRKGTGLS